MFVLMGETISVAPASFVMDTIDLLTRDLSHTCPRIDKMVDLQPSVLIAQRSLIRSTIHPQLSNRRPVEPPDDDPRGDGTDRHRPGDPPAD